MVATAEKSHSAFVRERLLIALPRSLEPIWSNIAIEDQVVTT